ncbi:type I glyceraldehyde-3-phosphate dehydrogenase, partial [Sesbania bispinosa]
GTRRDAAELRWLDAKWLMAATRMAEHGGRYVRKGGGTRKKLLFRDGGYLHTTEMVNSNAADRRIEHSGADEV